MPLNYNNAVHNKQVSGATISELNSAAAADNIHANTLYLTAENRLFLGKTVNSLIELALKTDLSVNYISSVAANNQVVHNVDTTGKLTSVIKFSPKSGNRTAVLTATGEEGIFTEGYTIHPDSVGLVEIVNGNQFRLMPSAINDVLDAGTMSFANYLTSVNYSPTNKIIQKGDFVICNSENKIFIHKGTYNGNATDFQEMIVPVPTQALIRSWFSQGDGIAYNSASGVNSVRLGASSGLLSFDASGGLVSSLPTWAQVSGKPTLATVATTGRYIDLLDKPTIAPAQVNSDWNATTGLPQILNKPALALVATSGAITDTTGNLPWSRVSSAPNFLTTETSNLQNVMQRGSVTNLPLTLNNKLIGGFGSTKDTGFLDWNHISNARSGNGETVLTNVAANGFAENGYYYPFSFEYYSYNGTGNLTQFAIPYLGGNNMHIRSRYEQTWSPWRSFVIANNSQAIGNSTILTSANYPTYNSFTNGIILPNAGGNVSITNSSGAGVIAATLIAINAPTIQLNATNISATIADQVNYPYLNTLGGDLNNRFGKILVTDLLKAKNGMNRNATDNFFKLGGDFTENTTSNLASFNYALNANTTGKSIVFGDVATAPFMLISGRVRNITDDFEVTAASKGFCFKDDAGNMVRLRCNAAGNFYRELL